MKLLFKQTDLVGWVLDAKIDPESWNQGRVTNSFHDFKDPPSSWSDFFKHGSCGFQLETLNFLRIFPTYRIDFHLLTLFLMKVDWNSASNNSLQRIFFKNKSVGNFWSYFSPLKIFSNTILRFWAASAGSALVWNWIILWVEVAHPSAVQVPGN